jgi:hypothetical protein
MLLIVATGYKFVMAVLMRPAQLNRCRELAVVLGRHGRASLVRSVVLGDVIEDAGGEGESGDQSLVCRVRIPFGGDADLLNYRPAATTSLLPSSVADRDTRVVHIDLATTTKPPRMRSDHVERIT